MCLYVNVRVSVHVCACIRVYVCVWLCAHVHVCVCNIHMYINVCVQICRVKQIVGFDAEDMIGQKILDFFHPKELISNEHTKCRRTCKSYFSSIQFQSRLFV